MPPNIDPCADFKEARDEALEDMQDALDDLVSASEDLEDAESFWDESTWQNVGTAAAIAVACASNPIGWVACGTGWIIGTAAVVASEVDRSGDIEAAEKALAKANRDFWKEHNDYLKALSEEAHCRLHNQLTGVPA
jgi:hypothetical protein